MNGVIFGGAAGFLLNPYGVVAAGIAGGAIGDVSGQVAAGNRYNPVSTLVSGLLGGTGAGLGLLVGQFLKPTSAAAVGLGFDILASPLPARANDEFICK